MRYSRNKQVREQHIRRKTPTAPKPPQVGSAPVLMKDWVKEGDRCTCILPEVTGTGTVQRVVKSLSIPFAVVKWDDGRQSHHTITVLRKS